MSELFLELFSEEIPAPLQSVARIKLIENIKNFFDKEKITYKGETNCFSTPNRLIVHFKNLNNEIIQKPEEIRGPNIKAPDKALEGFLKSNKIEEKDIFINAIKESGLKRVIWVSENETNDAILDLKNLIYLKHKEYKGVEEKILDLESQETVEYGLIDLST